MKMVDRLLKVITCCAIVYAVPVQQAVGQEDLLKLQEVQEHVAAQVERGGLVGVSIAYIDTAGRALYRSEGTLERGGDKQVDQRTIYEIGSVTKVFTTLLLAQMLGEPTSELNAQNFAPDSLNNARLDLDDPVEYYLPDSLDLPEYEGQKITLRHLATHSSGLPRLPDNLTIEDPDNPYASYSLRDLYRFLDMKEFDLTRAPGSQFTYSNLGMGLLGHLLERISGKPYEQLVRERIAEPLLMESTGIDIAGEDSSRFATGYDTGGKEASNWDLPTLAGAGALRSTAEDMAAFMRAQLGFIDVPFAGGIRQTHKIQFKTEDQPFDALGLGWIHSADYDSVIWHSGGTGGYRSFVGFNKEKGTGAVVLSNTTQPIDIIGLHLLDRRYELPEIVEEETVSEEALELLTGQYRAPSGLLFSVTREVNQLYVRLQGQARGRVYARSDSVFVNDQVQATFTFHKASPDSVSGMTLEQYGQTISASKISDMVPEPPQHTEIEIDPKILDRYVGRYKMPEGNIMMVTKQDEQLYIQLSGQPRVPVYPESENEFFLKVVEAKVEFIRDEDGKYSGLILYQGGVEYEAERIY